MAEATRIADGFFTISNGVNHYTAERTASGQWELEAKQAHGENASGYWTKRVETFDSLASAVSAVTRRA